METKIFELRDRLTFIPIIAIKPCGANMPRETAKEEYLIRRAGYGSHNSCVLLTRLDASWRSGRCTHDPYDWNDRTFHNAHLYIQENWDNLKSGDLIDIEFILQETSKPKESEFLTAPIDMGDF